MLERSLHQPQLGRLAAILLAGLIALTLVIGLVSEAVAVPRSGRMPFSEGVLWKVERPGEDPSYVFGTIHLSRNDILSVPEVVKDALYQARNACFEIKFDDRTATTWLRTARAGRRDTLDAVLGPDLFADLVAVAEPYGYSVHLLRQLRPWAIILTLGKPPSVVEDEDEDDGKPVLDDWLYQQAEERGIPTCGLESVRQHVSPFADLTMEEKRSLIRARIESFEVDQTEVERRYAEFVRRYLAGDIGSILQGAGDEVPPEYAFLNAEVTRRLLDDRNHLMVERMLPRLKQGKAFVAVGAGHLPGEEGVLALLAEHGYAISRVH